MESDDSQIVDAVIGVITRYGTRRATMDELARHSGVSRQTLYDRYGDKDGVIAAAISLSASRTEQALKVAFEKDTALAEKIEAFYDIAIWPIYDLVCSMPDAADLEKGLGAKSKAMSDAMQHRRQDILAAMFSRYVSQGVQTPQQIAVFFDQSCSSAKKSCEGAEDLASYLSVLKDSTVALVERQPARD